LPNFNIEKSFDNPVIGVDEVGRGSLAGPVVSCACIFLNYNIDKEILRYIDDSKKLSLSNRLNTFRNIQKLKKEKKLIYSIGFANVVEIDKLNILEATKVSMERAIKKLNYKNLNLIIDGNIELKIKKLKSTCITKGDQKSFSIAAASIIAKIHRDRYMKFLSRNFPSYNWEKNVGYGTKKHVDEIIRIGITNHHRKSFEPIKSLIHNK